MRIIVMLKPTNKRGDENRVHEVQGVSEERRVRADAARGVHEGGHQSSRGR